MKLFYHSVSDALSRLDDSDEKVWTREEIFLYLQRSYRDFCRKADVIFDFFYPEALYAHGSITQEWERDFATYDCGLIQYTGGLWERPYHPQTHPVGPVTHTAPWESAYVEHGYPEYIQTLPNDYSKVDRVTFDLRELRPEYHRLLAQKESDYEDNAGTPERFILQKDGVNSLRLVPSPAGEVNTYDHETDDGYGSPGYGILKCATLNELGDDTPTGERGVLRNAPEHFPCNSQWGGPRRLINETANTRVEFFREGRDPNGYEIPDQFVKYVEFGAMAQALKKEGPGQDLNLATHYAQRFDIGVQRMNERNAMNHNKRTGRIGGRRSPRTQAPALCRLPSNYGPSSPLGGF